MKRFTSNHQNTDLSSLDKASGIAVSDISIDKLVDDGLLILYREIKNLASLSSRGKLDAASARDLRDHLKLIFELKDRENSLLKGLSDEQLKEIAFKGKQDAAE